jgi:hypothetical protein
MQEGGDMRYEARDVSPGLVAKFGVILVVLSVATAAGGLVLFRILAARGAARERTPVAYERSADRGLPPEPRLQTAPYADLERLVAEQRKALDSYGWVDEKAGVVRIPVDRAMELLVERGLPHRAAGTASETPR